ncbi:MAG: 60S ribosomal subunit assembly/export protein [Candelina submexicana]|nr:MAG: 60S ribosomal subunit assembly/export protein [Candelina submexicana]
MAPSRTTTVKSKSGKSTSKGASKSSSSKSSTGTPTSNNRVSKTKSKGKPPPPKQQKTKPPLASVKKKPKIYTDEQLGIPKLNMITPAGVVEPKGKKKGKVFVDDRESLMTILAMVNADKEGQIESKMMKARQMEEIREARKQEAEARQEERKSKLEDTKNAMRKKRKRRTDAIDAPVDSRATLKHSKTGKKRVAFA